MIDGSAIAPDTLHRGVKMALDSGEAESVEAAYAIFARYRVSVVVSPEAARTPAHQAALLTIVNAGRRSLLGGVSVTGADGAPLLLKLPGAASSLCEAIVAYGGACVPEPCHGAPIIMLGRSSLDGDLVLNLTFGRLSAGVFPAGEGEPLEEPADGVIGAVVAAGLAVSEVFQNRRGNPMAGRREVGLSLWDPTKPWRVAPGPERFFIPSRIWMVGLGHLGQAFLWLYTLLPFAPDADIMFALRDFDALTLANDSTSMLTQRINAGRLKTRHCATWVEARGFGSRLIERRFGPDLRVNSNDPRVLVCGADNASVRAAMEAPGFELVVEAGLGAGPQDYLAMRMHTFPASVSAQAKWGGAAAAAESPIDAPAYEALKRKGADQCGLVELASRTVGAPFVGIVAAGLTLSEIIRRLSGGPAFEVVDLTLRDLGARTLAPATVSAVAFNPGFASLR